MPQRLGGEAAQREPAINRVLLIDYDPALSEVVAALLEHDGLEVFQHNCPAGSCLCKEEVLRLRPALVMVNVVDSGYGNAEHQGWRCLQNVGSLALHLGALVVAYTIFDRTILDEMGLDLRALPVPLYTEVSSPADFTREISARLTDSLVA